MRWQQFKFLQIGEDCPVGWCGQVIDGPKAFEGFPGVDASQKTRAGFVAGV